MNRPDFPSLLPELLPRLWVFALRITGNQHDAEDLVQRACERALQRAEQWQADTSVLSWMFSIVHSTWMNELRSRSIRNRSNIQWDDDHVEMVADPATATPEQAAIHAQVVGAIGRLPEAQRVVMLLVGAEGYSYAEAAQVLQIPIGTVMSRLSRARQTIGALFNGSGAQASAQTGERQSQ